MQTINNGYRSLSLIMRLSADRILIPAAIILSLLMAASLSVYLAEQQVPGSIGIF